jgi:flagellar biosynthesis repressor protein FlbT
VRADEPGSGRGSGAHAPEEWPRWPLASLASAAVRLQHEVAMALRIELKPFERVIIGDCVITNSNSRTSFRIDGKAPILREKDILTPEKANTPVKRLYLCVQLMYLEDDIPKYQEVYMSFIRDLLKAMPSFRGQLEGASNLILSGSCYNALKVIKKMMKREEELLKVKHV